MTGRDGHNEQDGAVIGRVSGGDALPALEPELAALAAGLDEAARVERASAPAGLSQRVFEASRAALAAKPAPDVIARIRPAAVGRRAVLTPLRAAAGLALAATVVLAILGGRSPGTSDGLAQGAALETDVTEWLALSNLAVGDLAAEIDVIDVDTAILRDELSGGPVGSDLFMDEGAF